MAKHNDLGKLGEDKAIALLLSKSHQLLARNFRYGHDEVDIITKCAGYVVFTEVKTRSNITFGNPEEFVDLKKRRAMKKVADEYVFQNNLDCAIRFDVIAVTLMNSKIELYHIEDAFFDEDTDAYH